MEKTQNHKPDKSELVKDAVHKLLQMFESGKFPEAVVMSVIRKREGEEIPSDKWSLGNRLLIHMQGTEDARGYKQWQMCGRQVKKGTKAIYIFSPATKIIKEKNLEGEEEKKIIITGFYPTSVFRYEDTEGEKLPEYNYQPKKYPPFFDVAEKLGIEISYKPLKYDYYGRYNKSSDSIELCSESAVTYYHELAHALDNRLNGDLKKSSEQRNEIVAEFSAIVLCQLSGIEGYEDQSYKYIKHYCEKDKSNNAILKSIMKILSDVEKIVNEVLNVSSDFEELKKVA